LEAEGVSKVEWDSALPLWEPAPPAASVLPGLHEAFASGTEDRSHAGHHCGVRAMAADESPERSAVVKAKSGKQKPGGSRALQAFRDGQLRRQVIAGAQSAKGGTGEREIGSLRIQRLMEEVSFATLELATNCEESDPALAHEARTIGIAFINRANAMQALRSLQHADKAVRAPAKGKV
jgi:hypothetical protein